MHCTDLIIVLFAYGENLPTTYQKICCARMREHADLTNTILAQTRVRESRIAALAKNCTANFRGVRLIQFTTRWNIYAA